MRLTRALAPSLMLSALLFPGSASPAASDFWITTKTKIALFSTPGVHAPDVDVDTVDGVVTLHGTVAAQDVKQRAEEAARGVSGVKQVRDLLQVVPPARQQAVAAKDADVEQRLKDALAAEASLAGSEIGVQSVHNGVALLSGRAKTAVDHLRALEVASRVPGVVGVESEIESPDTKMDRRVWSEAKSDHAQTRRTVSGAVGDAAITTRTKLRLLTDRRTPRAQIEVDTRDGAVTLFGMVPTADARRAAEDEARQVSGVGRVVNQLQVVPTNRQEAVRARDRELERAIRRQIADRRELRDAVSVQVENGAARLTGTVGSEAERREAEIAAKAVEGVREVLDGDLLVSRSSAESHATSGQRSSAAERAASSDKGMLGSAVDAASDALITSKTKFRLMSESRAPGTDIDVGTRAGVVTLFGIVPSDEGKRAAEEEARKVSGVDQVRNELQVVPPSKLDSVKESDREIEREVNRALEDQDALRDATVDVEVKNGVARLTGAVSNQDERRAAVRAAQQTKGVRSVLDHDLRVSSSDER